MVDFFHKSINFIGRKEVYGVIVTAAFAYFIYKTITFILEEGINKGKTSYERKKRTTITKLFNNIIKYIIVIIACLTILSIYGVNVKGMIAGLGITATIIGLALQDTFKDIINGISIIMDNYFIVGDIVRYGNFTGEIIEFGLKSTKIKNVNGEVLTVANRNIMEITNLSQKEQKVSLKISLPYEEDIDKIETIIKKKVLPKLNNIADVIEDSPEYLGIDELADSSVIYLIVFNCHRETHWQAKRDANKIILQEFGKENIHIPYPQLEVHNEK